MRIAGWRHLLQGFILWGVHFLTLYIIASVFLTTPLARVLTLAVTAACVGVAGWMFVVTKRQFAEDPTESWMRAVSLSGLVIASIAILWQGFPAIFT